MYILMGNTAPVERTRRPVEADVRAQARRLLRPPTGHDPDEWFDDQTDEQLAARVSEDRILTGLSTVNGQSITEIRVPDGTPRPQIAKLVQMSWAANSTEPPAWIVADTPRLTAFLVEVFTTYDETGWEETYRPDDTCPDDWMVDPAGKKPPRVLPPTIAGLLTVLWGALVVGAVALQLRTNAGRDFQSRVMGDGTEVNAGTGNMRPADFLAITENSDAPAAGDTALTGELSGGGLERSQATYSHSAASTTYTLVFEWTSSDGTPREINKNAVFNASSTGTMPFESLVPSPPTLVAGDKLENTITVDIA
jgi:hypothetical protein